MRAELPAEFDAAHYAGRYKDLRRFSDTKLRDHYLSYGKREGRSASIILRRDDFLSIIERGVSTLEIGPFLQPCLKRPEHSVEYFDVLDRDGMIKRAQQILDGSEEKHEYFVEGIRDAREICYVHPEGDLSSVEETFGNVFSSHCIEHQVDIIKHLNDVYDILEPGGRYYVIAPDKRYCFDYFHPESRFVDAVAAHLEKRKFHTPTKVLEHLMNCTHNDPTRHWAGDHGERRLDSGLYEQSPDHYRHALDLALSATWQYVDVHNWIFTPDSFREVIDKLFEKGFVKMPLVRVYPTVFNSMEFYAVFEKPM